MTTEIRVPDIGDFKDVPVIELHVGPGAVVKPEDPLITLESDKATMDVPRRRAAPSAEVRVKLGDRVSEGSVILTLEAEGAAVAAKEKVKEGAAPAPPRDRPTTARRAASTTKSRSRSPTSATSRTCR